ncbi:hypothetical protein TcWFU_002325 [Taenia crassiceps]|uniref:Talin central domain-containing protein n=1 Tax=Taenia crassiceps TaxID=6207 RepID=A0ABR4Q7Z0_9CEST
MTSERSRHDRIVAHITRHIRPSYSPAPTSPLPQPSHHLKPPPRGHLPLSRCDQDITSPICLIDEKAGNPVPDLLEDTPTSSSRESAASDETWLTSSVSVTSRCVGDTVTPLPCVSAISQGNTNYVPRQTTVSPDPTEIDKCTELEAMKQGLARIQAGHARPSDFLPQHHTTNVDPYIRRTLDEIRRSINEISTDAALQQEVQQLRDSVKKLSVCKATVGGASNESEAQLAGLLQDIRASLRPAPLKADQCNATASGERGIMKALEEIRQSVHELQAAVEEASVETVPVADTTNHDNPAVMAAINDIRQSLHNLCEGVSTVGQDNTNEHEDSAIMEALNEIRQNVNVLVHGTQAGALEEEPANEILQALTEIRNSVRVLASEEGQGQGQGQEQEQEQEQSDDKDACGKDGGDATMEMAACAMVQSMERLQKTVEKISQQLLTNSSKATSQCEKKDRRRKRKKVSRGKSESSSNSEVDEDDIAQCIKECCQDSCKFGSTCDKLIRFLISQNCSFQRASAPSLHYLVPPQAQPPKFIAPFYRMPRSVPPPPPPPATMALPPPPMPSCHQSSTPSHLPQATLPPHQPPFTRSNNLCGAVSMATPRFPPPYATPMSCPQQYQFQQPPPTTGFTVPPQSVPQSAPPTFNQCSSYAPQSACSQLEVNAAAASAAGAPSLSACNQDSTPPILHQPPPPSQHSSTPKCEQDQPIVFTATVNDQPLAFTLTFAGTTDASAGSNCFPSYANRTFLCTQVEQ